MKFDSLSRRQFLQRAASVAAGSCAYYATSARLQLANAQVGPANDYKALVCIFLFGGNDAFNMLVPRGDAEYAIYKSTRQTLALAQEELLPITPESNIGLEVGFHPAMQQVQSLFAAKKLGVVANVGALIEPVSKSTYANRSVALPPQLFSHNDQQTFLQSLQSTIKRNGWVGRAADVMGSFNTNQNLSMNISLSGSNIWQSGNTVTPYSIDAAGIKEIDNLNTKSTDAREVTRIQVYKALLAQQQQHPLQQEFARTQAYAWELAGEVKTALDAQTPLTTQFPSNNPLANSLKMVARIISARAALGVSRQTFFIGMGDFDTHGDQLRRHVTLLTQLSEGLNAFYNATTELGVADKITTFTTSDFGRTLTSNGDGTDHGWGSHQLIMGDAINGGDIYGALPELVIGGNNDAGEGRIIPAISMDQYAATLASWYGVPAGNYATIFPNLHQFNDVDLGFFS